MHDMKGRPLGGKPPERGGALKLPPPPYLGLRSGLAWKLPPPPFAAHKGGGFRKHPPSLPFPLVEGGGAYKPPPQRGGLPKLPPLPLQRKGAGWPGGQVLVVILVPALWIAEIRICIVEIRICRKTKTSSATPPPPMWFLKIVTNLMFLHFC